MKKLLLTLLLTMVGMTAYAQAPGVATPQTSAQPVAVQKFLGDRHVQRGLQCDACHTPDQKIKQNGDLDVCSQCHGDYSAMIAKTKDRYEEVNPHAQHEGVLPCTECHKGHKPGVNYCGQCHSHSFNVP